MLATAIASPLTIVARPAIVAFETITGLDGRRDFENFPPTPTS
jgi:hypothetical protein